MGKRETISDNRKRKLYGEVNGICPLCGRILLEKKNKNSIDQGQVAHIYPLNPNENQLKVLKGVDKLGNDINDDENLIYLCPTCHKKYDTDTTLEEYQKIFNIKKRLLRLNKIKEKYFPLPLDEKIEEVIKELTSLEEPINSNISIEYNPKKVDTKLKGETMIFKRKVKNDVSSYYSIIREIFRNIDDSGKKFEKISLQIKAFYIEAVESELTKEEIYDEITKWISIKTKEKYSKEVYNTIVSFFIQNCEVF